MERIVIKGGLKIINLSQKGFTLIEVMVSLVIGVILIIGFSGALVNGLRAEDRIDDRLEARRINNSIIENLRNNRDNWKNTDNHYGDYSIEIIESGEAIINTDADIIVEYEEAANDLYMFEIEWKTRKYSSEILLVGE